MSECGHSLFINGCASCCDRMVQRLQEPSSRRRDALTEQQIVDARGPVETPGLEGPFDDKPDALGTFPIPGPVTTATDKTCTVLRGDSHTAYVEFTAAASALEAHQKQGGEVLERYKAALQKLSAIAARSGG